MKKNHIELNRWIANNCDLSRRKATDLIKNKRVSVNSVTVEKPYFMVSSADKIKLNGHQVEGKQVSSKIYYAINKPRGYVSATKADSTGSPPITTLVSQASRIYPVGRLDIESQGLLMLTNDGDLTYLLTHPKHSVEKEYLVSLEGSLTDKKISNLSKGIKLKEGSTKPSNISIVEQGASSSILRFIIHEGKNRQIRRMCASQDLHVTNIQRIRIGTLTLGNLKVGKSRRLSISEVDLLRSACK